MKKISIFNISSKTVQQDFHYISNHIYIIYMKVIVQPTPQATDQYVESTECQFHIIYIIYINKS